MRKTSMLAAALLACGDARRPAPDSAAAGRAAADFTLTDTADFHGMTNDGRRAILRSRDGAAIDTVELGFGVHRVGRDSLLLLPVRTEVVGTDTVTDITEHVLLLHGGRRVTLKSILPRFDDWFSSPAVLDGSTIYYWGLRGDSAAGAEGGRRIFAMRYDLSAGRPDSLDLGTIDVPGTDDRGFFSRPFREGDAVIFQMAERRWRWR